MSIQGSLQSISVMELFSSLLQWGKTGVLTILTEAEERGFLFYKGNLVYATSRDSARRLGAFLVRLGYITAEELSDTLERSPSGQGSFGQRLIDQGRITQRQLRAAVRAQLFDIFLEVLSWENGAFLFDDQELPFPVTDGLLTSTQTLLLEAATKVDESSLVARVAGSGSTAVRRLLSNAAPRPSGSEAPPAPEGGDAGADAELGWLAVDAQVETAKAAAEAGSNLPEIPLTTIAPDVPSKIFAISGTRGVGDDRIYDVIAREPMLAAKVLKVLTLSNVALERNQLTLRLLVERLGGFNTRCILLPEAVRALWFPRNQAYWREAWEHDQICAQICEQIAIKIGYTYPGEAYLAGLLHNLGTYILLTSNPEEYRKVVTASLASSRDLEALEKEAFGISHARVGEIYARRWNFPPTVQLAIKDHHRVNCKLSRPLLHMIHVATRVAHDYGYRMGFHEAAGEELGRSLEELGLSESELISLFIDARHRVSSDYSSACVSARA